MGDMTGGSRPNVCVKHSTHTRDLNSLRMDRCWEDRDGKQTEILMCQEWKQIGRQVDKCAVELFLRGWPTDN